MAAHKDSISLAVNAKQVARILRSETGHNTIFSVQVAGGAEEKAMLKDWQVDPVNGCAAARGLAAHRHERAMRVRVPVHTFGEPQGVKLQGGIFEMVSREVEVECLPGDIPEEFKVDVSALMIGKQLRAGDLPVDPEKMKLLTDVKRVLAHVVTLKKEEEPTPEAAVAAEAAPAEPEVIKKGKKEEEGEGEGAAKPQLPRPKRRARRSSRRREVGALRNSSCHARLGAIYETDRRPRQRGRGVRVDAAQPGLSGVDALAGRGGNSGHAAGSQSAGRARRSWPGSEVVLAKPQTMMNLSGVSVRGLLERYECEPAEMIVLIDEIDLPWGMLRMRDKGRNSTHNGLKSIISALGTDEFIRVRMGVQPERLWGDRRDYVLRDDGARGTEDALQQDGRRSDANAVEVDIDRRR